MGIGKMDSANWDSVQETKLEKVGNLDSAIWESAIRDSAIWNVTTHTSLVFPLNERDQCPLKNFGQ